MISSESAEEDGPSESSSDSTTVAVDEENAQLMQFAHADCVELKTKHPVSFFSRVKRVFDIVLHGIGYLVFLPLWPQRLSRVEARRIRDTLSPTAKQRPWYIGIVPFYFINWLLWHLCKHIKKLDLNIDDGKHAWEIMQGIWSRAFLNKGEFFVFFAEVRPRDFESFQARDKTFFMAHNGDIFTKPSREILFYALILSHRGNRFIRLLYSWACELIDDKTFNLENHVTLARFFHGDRNQWMNRIKHVRREALERLEKYAENMLRYTMDNGQVETAMHWNDVICRVRQLKGFRPMVSNRGEMSRLVKELVDGFNAAGRRTYVICRSYAETPPQIECQVTVAKGGKKGETPQEIKELGRFKVEIYEKHYLIRDTIQNKKYKINLATNAGGITRELILNCATGTDQTHASDDSWKGAFQSGRGDATKFKRDQIFILPRWNAEKGRFMPTQSSNRWRLWTDEELKLSKQERLQKFIDEHPNGLPN